jgi:glycosidase
MNEHAILHIPDSNFCFPVGVKKLTLRLRVKRGEEISRVVIIHACKYTFHENRQESPMEKKYSDRLFDFYEATLELSDVRFAYLFRLSYNGKDYYFSEDGLTEKYDFKYGFYNSFQVPYLHDADRIETVAWMKDAVFYEIFVDRFYRGCEEKEDSYINLKWGEKPTPKSFAGGDLKGIQEKLDYLKELGVNTIYLTPIFTSISNHKYDISDYKQIDPHFGTNDDFRALVESAHGKGMRIVLDAVFNHCGAGMMQFQDVLKKGKKSPYFDWFIIDGDKPDMEAVNYECFGFSNYMPKLNADNKEVREFLLDIALFWIREYDIDGWRLDVSDEISHNFWRIFRKAVKQEKSDCVIIGENWHNAYAFLRGDEYDGIMNYAFTKACLDLFKFGTVDAMGFAGKLNHLLMRNKDPVNAMMLNLLDSHDTYRFFTEIKKDKDKLLAAVAIMTCFTGAPCIYYGTEICLEGGFDPDCRRTFDWEESNWDEKVMTGMKNILALKQRKPLQEGGISISAVGEILVMVREWAGHRIVLLYNNDKKPVAVDEFQNSSVVALVWNGYLIKERVLQSGGFLVFETQRG